MPLKSKGKGRKGVKQQQQQRNAAESQAEVTNRKAFLEVDMHMVCRRDMAWQVSADSKGLKRRLRDLEKALELAREDKRDVHEAMARQHQELQEQTASRSCSLEAEVKSLRVHLATRLRESRQAQEMAAQALAEKDVTIAQLQGRLNAMEMEYEKILHGSLDLVLAKLAGASQRWEEMGTTISLEHRECLKEFGLNPLEIQRPGDPQDRTGGPGPCLPLPSDVPYPLPTTPAPLGQARGQKQQVQSGLGTHH